MNDSMKKWLKAVGERTISTAAETALATIGAAGLIGDVDWKMVASATALSVVVTILKNLVFQPSEIKAVSK